MIAFYFNTLIYSLRFYMILRIGDVAILVDPNPIGPPREQPIP